MPPHDEMAPHRLGLLDQRMRSMAPDFLVDRVLVHYKLIGLTDETIRQLLDLAGEYRQERTAAEDAFALLGHKVSPVATPLGPEQAAERREHFARRAALFAEDDMRAETYYDRVRTILGEQGWAALLGVYLDEVTARLHRLGPALAAAVAPAFQLLAEDPEGVHRPVDPYDDELTGALPALV
ncbi:MULTISPECIES: hypothetical protein [Frankia]|uniref:hypothetical protein n=3 Tax=Frankiaceae TaxID=74712 RepID=UPI0021C0A195|nr:MULTISPECIES: hypothetical protein [Frankia]